MNFYQNSHKLLLNNPIIYEKIIPNPKKIANFLQVSAISKGEKTQPIHYIFSASLIKRGFPKNHANLKKPTFVRGTEDVLDWLGFLSRAIPLT